MPPVAARVLMTTDAVGGVWTYALELSRGLSARGIEIGLATMGPLPTPQQRAAAGSIGGLTLFENDCLLEWMQDPWDDVTRAGEWLLRLEQDYAPDLVHVNNYCHGALPFRAPVLVVGHSCVLSWWSAVHGCEAPPSWDRYRAEVSRGLAAAAIVAAPSGAMLEALTGYYGPFRRAVVLPNGIDLCGAPGAPKEPFIFSAGRLWDEGKNLAVLDAATVGLSWPVFVAGDTVAPDGRSPEATACRPLGRLAPDETRQWMRRAAIYALPALYEPFGLSILEAASAGCALVVGDIPSLRELWHDCAVFVPPRDPAALRAALNSLAHTPALLADWGRRALDRSREFTRDRMTRAYLDTYRLAVGLQQE